MQIPIRGLPYEVPQYSLTGDIVAHFRCGLQYRYYNRSSLPPSRPVQLWTGEFVHGVMEEAFLYWKTNHTPFPWPSNPTSWPANANPLSRASYDIGELGDRVEARLKAAGKSPRSSDARNAAYRRVEAALQILAPHLFPLITAVEEKVSATRQMLPQQTIIPGQQPRGDRYELVGRVDVISNVSLINQASNELVKLITATTLGHIGNFDVIVDYKAARRPPTQPPQNVQHSHWTHEAMQVQLYAWMREQQPQAQAVKAGLLIYINELAPSASELKEYIDEIKQNRTDITPTRGTPDYYALYGWNGQQPLPSFSKSFLLQRAIRIVPVDTQNLNLALSQIDQSVADIENCVMRENATGDIPSNWHATGDDQDCDACDFRRFCPNPASVRNIAPSSRRVKSIETPG